MYEFIMELPLFKGLSKENVSLFLEKTSIGFNNFKNDEIIIAEGEQVKTLKFLINGNIKLIYDIEKIDLRIEETLLPGATLGVDRLFGFHTQCPYTAISVGNSSIMEFSKEQYMNLLNSDRIYLLNFFNFISLGSQKSVDSALLYSAPDFKTRLQLLLNLLTTRKTAEVEIIGKLPALLNFSRMSQKEFFSWVQENEMSGMIKYHEGSLKILSVSDFLS